MTERPAPDTAAMSALQQMSRRAPGRVSRHAQAVLWWLVGQSQTVIARRLGVTRQSVQAWCARFRAAGADGLWDRPRSGRPPRAGPATTARVVACLRQSDLPGTTGPGGWTVPRLVAALAAVGDRVSGRTVRRLLR